MGKYAEVLPPKGDLDDLVKKVLMIVKTLNASYCLPPSSVAVRQVIRKLIRDEVWQRTTSDVDGLAFLGQLDSAFAVDPLDPKVLCGSIYWEKRLENTGLQTQVDYAAELLAAACEAFNSIIIAEMLGS